MDKWMKLYTALYIVFSISLIFYLFFSNAPDESVYIVGFVIGAAFLVSYLMVPKIYIQGNGIILKNTFSKMNISANNITSIETYPIIKFNFRTMGVGGVFGFFGYFNWGEVWYVTNIYKKVKILMNSGRVYMISAENPEAFVEEVKKMMQS